MTIFSPTLIEDTKDTVNYFFSIDKLPEKKTERYQTDSHYLVEIELKMPWQKYRNTTKRHLKTKQHEPNQTKTDDLRCPRMIAVDLP